MYDGQVAASVMPNKTLQHHLGFCQSRLLQFEVPDSARPALPQGEPSYSNGLMSWIPSIVRGDPMSSVYKILIPEAQQARSTE
jgi:hypothetical protein